MKLYLEDKRISKKVSDSFTQEEDFEEYFEDRNSYSPSMPWNAPGMSVSDFI